MSKILQLELSSVHPINLKWFLVMSFSSSSHFSIFYICTCCCDVTECGPVIQHSVAVSVSANCKTQSQLDLHETIKSIKVVFLIHFAYIDFFKKFSQFFIKIKFIYALV